MTDRNGRAKKRANQAAFLAAFSQSGVVSRSADEANVARSSVYEWLADEDDTEFNSLFKSAQEAANDVLESEARRRAVDGWDEPVFHIVDGEVVENKKRKFSDTLLIFLMKGAMPEKYKDRTDVTSGGNPIKAYIGFTPDEI